jgi:hypothetical protein
MPDYLPMGMTGQPAECPIHPDDGSLPLSYLLRRRPSSTNTEKQGPGTLQVAQRGEFRYIGRAISRYRPPIGQIQRRTGSKMIANGRFWMAEGPRGRAPDDRTGRKGLFGISLPAGMIQDPSHRTEGETLHVRHDPKGYSPRRRRLFTHPENRCPEGYQVAQKGEFRYIDLGIWAYRGRIGQNQHKTGSKMIANGRFPAGDQLPGCAAVL